MGVDARGMHTGYYANHGAIAAVRGEIVLPYIPCCLSEFKDYFTLPGAGVFKTPAFFIVVVDLFFVLKMGDFVMSNVAKNLALIRYRFPLRTE
jgi:hypothetical protein